MVIFTVSVFLPFRGWDGGRGLGVGWGGGGGQCNLEWPRERRKLLLKYNHSKYLFTLLIFFSQQYIRYMTSLTKTKTIFKNTMPSMPSLPPGIYIPLN